MGILSNIFSKIFPSSHPAANPAPATAGGAAPAAAPTATPASAITQVDAEAILNDMAKKNSEKLNWSTSIVDLLKLLGLDSSLNARKELAKELNYTGDTSDSATMNVWLHKQVMIKLAENGGKIPDALKN
jgi:3-oxoacyl-ACP reductase-like protein